MSKPPNRLVDEIVGILMLLATFGLLALVLLPWTLQ